MNKKEFIKSLFDNRVNMLVATDINFFDLLYRYGLVNDKVILIDGTDNFIEDILCNCSSEQTIVVKDSYEDGIVNWNKLLIIIKNNPKCHFIRWRTIKNSGDIKVSYDVSNIVCGLVYINED